MTPSKPDYQPNPATDCELLPVVDDHDRVLRLAPRQEIHAKGLHHRAVHVILLDVKGRALLQKRSASKDSYPGCWDISVGGHVGPGESYAETARREIAEEMGYREIEPQPIALLEPDMTTGWEFIRLFVATVAGEPRPDPEEIEDFRWVDPAELIRRVDPNGEDALWRLTPASTLSFRRWWRLGAPGLPRENAPR